MKKILVPTDFSKNAYNALKYAVQLLKDEECTFFLLNTYTPSIFDNEYVKYNAKVPSLNEICRNDSLASLWRTIKKIKKDYPNEKHHFKKLSFFNVLTEEVRTQVKEKKIDLIIMGTKGATGAKEILLGTNTVHIIRSSVCPVLAVPSLYNYKEPKKILFPTDFEINLDLEELDLVRTVAQKHQSKMEILHVLQDNKLSNEQENGKESLRTSLEGINYQIHMVQSESVSEAIYEFQQKKKVNLLCMINNKHSFFENIFFRPLVSKMGFHTKIPFLVIPTKKTRKKEIRNKELLSEV